MRFRRAALLLLLLVALVAVLPADAAKKKRKSKKAKVADTEKQVDRVACGVCIAAVAEIQEELQKTENSTSTLDLRWGLTSEVTDGRAKRLGKVIPYKRSELRSVEIIEGLCAKLTQYGSYAKIQTEIQLRKIADMGPGEKPDGEQRKRDHSAYERHCERLVDEQEKDIINAVRDELNATQFQDALCFSEAGPCGPVRTKCPFGAFSEKGGVMPCTLCPRGFFQKDEGSTACVPCGEGKNTTQEGMMFAEGCIAECLPGSYSATGLESCSKCGAGAYQPARSATGCTPCPPGLSTDGEGAAEESACRALCGDSRRAPDEGCDDGNTYPGDGCSPECKVEVGAFCIGKVGSASTCKVVTCGDGEVHTSNDATKVENCDDGNGEGGDGCSDVCQIEPAFRCTDEDDKVSACNKVECGDGKKQQAHDGSSVEACDDSNTADGDGCSGTCEIEEGFLCSGVDDSLSRCHQVKCGDGLRESSGSASEGCDDGNMVEGDGCSPACTIEDNFTCTPGSVRSGFSGLGRAQSRGRDACKRVDKCGDGFRTGAEACDDNNSDSGDGCSDACVVEAGFRCEADKTAAPLPGLAWPDVCVNKAEAARQAKKAAEKPAEKPGFFSNMFGKKGAEL